MEPVNKKLKEICVSEGISVLWDVLSEEWESFESRVSEICVKRIRVNQGLYLGEKVMRLNTKIWTFFPVN